MLWKTLGPEVEKVRKGWRKLRRPDAQFHDLFISPNTFRVIRSRRVGYVCGSREVLRILLGEHACLEDPGPGEGIILKWILEKW